MNIFDTLFDKLTPTDKAALTAALGWFASIEREYSQKENAAKTDVWNDPKYYPTKEEAKKDD